MFKIKGTMGKYSFAYSGNTYFFEKDETDKDKYIVFACAKNEDKYILEFVKHYLSIGFDKIIIADNNDDQTIVSKILKDYILKKQVQIFNCCGLKKFQLYLYNMYLNERNYKWCAYFDCDEFLELTTHTDIKDFLSCVTEPCILINWIVFGSDGNVHREDKPLNERFKCPVLPVPFFKENFYVKPIINGNFEGGYLSNTHCPSFVDNMSVGGYFHVNYTSHVYYPARYKYAFIRHYYTKSFDEWMSNKIQRGWPDEMFDVLKPTNFFIVDKNPDFQIIKYTNGFFVDNNSFSPEFIHKEYDGIMGKYEMIHLFSSTKNMYSITLHLFTLMREYTNHVFVLSDDIIDDPMYANMLSYAMMTGNKLAFAFNDADKFKILSSKTSWNSSLYYYMDCQ